MVFSFSKKTTSAVLLLAFAASVQSMALLSQNKSGRDRSGLRDREVQEYERKLKDLQDQLDDAFRARDRSRKEVDDFSNQVISLRREISDLKDANAKLSAENTVLKGKSGEVVDNSITISLQAQISSLNGENGRLRAELVRMKNSIAAYLDKIDMLTGDVEEAKKIIKSQRDRIFELENNNSAANGKDKIIADLKDQIASLTKQVAAFTKQIADLNDQNNALNSKLSSSNSLYQNSLRIIQGLKDDFSSLQDKYNSLQSDFDNYRSKFGNNSGQLKDLADQVASLKAANARLNAQISDLTAQLDAKVNDLKQLYIYQSQISDLQQQIAALKARLANASNDEEVNSLKRIIVSLKLLLKQNRIKYDSSSGRDSTTLMVGSAQ